MQRISSENPRELGPADQFEPNQSGSQVQDLCVGDIVGVESGINHVFLFKALVPNWNICIACEGSPRGVEMIASAA